MVAPFAGFRNVTIVPHGSVLCATPWIDCEYVWPHAVRLP
jgi:hypothetical protein